jgi:hypothetical protein
MKSLIALEFAFSPVVVAMSLVSLAGCGSSVGANAGSSDGGTHDAHESDAASDGGDADVDAGPACGPTPTRIVDAKSFVSPDAAVTGVQDPGVGVNATDLFFSLNLMPSGETDKGSIVRVPIRGGTQTMLATGTTVELQAVTSTRVLFWKADDGQSGELATMHVYAVSPHGGSATPLLAASDIFLGNDDQNAYFASAAGTSALSLADASAKLLTKAITSATATVAASLGTDLIVAETGGTLMSVPLSGAGPVTTLATKQDVDHLFACGTAVCWTTTMASITSGVSLMKLTPGSEPLALIPASDEGALSFLFGLLFDGTNFYWTQGDSFGALDRLPSAGGTPTSLVSMSGPGSLAMDEACLYWSNFDGIYSLAKSSVGPFPFSQ